MCWPAGARDRPGPCCAGWFTAGFSSGRIKACRVQKGPRDLLQVFLHVIVPKPLNTFGRHALAKRAEQRMNADTHPGHGHAKPTFAELFTPKLVTVLREGYRAPQFRADLIAGLTVAIVALPLSMAIAIASGVSPDRGLFTAIVGGFLISALGGSRFQIGGPAGAFIVLVAATVERHGLDGLLLATMMAGLFLIAMGYLRIGTY